MSTSSLAPNIPSYDPDNLAKIGFHYIKYREPTAKAIRTFIKPSSI